MNDILGGLPPARDLSAARVETLRVVLERTARESQPRRRRIATPWLLVPVGAVGALVAVALIVSSLLAPRAAYASWTSHPAALSAAETTELGTQCDVRAGSVPGAAADLRPVLGERRGTFQTALIASGPQLALCASWLGTQVGDTTRGSDLSGLTLDAVLQPQQVLRTIAVPGQLTGPDAARIAFGLVSPQVTQVMVTTADGRQVTASVQSGYFLAWWPSAATTTRIQALDGSGRVLAEQTGA